MYINDGGTYQWLYYLLTSLIYLRELITILIKKNLKIILVISLLILMFSGIVGAQNNGKAFEDLKLPSNVDELVKYFSYLNYDVVTTRNGEKVQDTTVEYDYLGKEDVENIETDKVSINIIDSQNKDMPSDMLFWFDGTNIKKMKVDGETISAQMAGVMGDRLLNAIFSPLYSLSEYNIETLRKMGDVSHSKEKFGGKDISITTIEVQNIPESDIKSGVAKLGEYKEKSFVLSFNYESSKEDLKMKFIVNEIEFH